MPKTFYDVTPEDMEACMQRFEELYGEQYKRMSLEDRTTFFVYILKQMLAELGYDIEVDPRKQVEE